MGAGVGAETLSRARLGAWPRALWSRVHTLAPSSPASSPGDLLKSAPLLGKGAWLRPSHRTCGVGGAEVGCCDHPSPQAQGAEHPGSLTAGTPHAGHAVSRRSSGGADAPPPRVTSQENPGAPAPGEQPAGDRAVGSSLCPHSSGLLASAGARIADNVYLHNLGVFSKQRVEARGTRRTGRS